MTGMERSRLKWSGKHRRIGREMLIEHFCDWKGPTFYVAGPPEMVAAMREMLKGNGVSEDAIRTEEVGGY